MNELKGDWCAGKHDGEIDAMSAEMDWTLGADGGRENGKESGYVEVER